MNNQRRLEGRSTRNPLDTLDNIAVWLEEVEKLVAREANSGCECIKSGWVYRLMDAINHAYDGIAELRATLRRECRPTRSKNE